VDERKLDRKKFLEVFFHFLGEVEAVSGTWLIPLGAAILIMKGPGVVSHYINGVNFTEPIFVVVIMSIASSHTILQFAEGSLKKFANFGVATLAAWWFAILTIGPLLGSFITEPAAMTICALLLAGKFYKLNPSMNLRDATLGLLFVHISIGGTFTHFAAPLVVMVAGKWNSDTIFILHHYGSLEILLWVKRRRRAEAIPHRPHSNSGLRGDFPRVALSDQCLGAFTVPASRSSRRR